jgi:SAM-dependent methyltransferase
MIQRPDERRSVKACHLCEGTRIYYLFSAADYRVVRCEDCGLVFLNPQPSDNELAQIRTGDNSSGSEPSAAKTLAEIARYRGAGVGKMLMVGADGNFREVAKAAGWDVTGVECSGAACDLATVSMAAWPFDLCVISDALEHVRSPLELLREIHRVLKPGGTLFVSTPSVESLSASSRQRGAEFNARNLTWFDRDTLQTALFKSNFREIIFENDSMAFARKAEIRPKPVLSVIVPAFNEANTFAALMESLLRKEVPGLHLEVIIVESNSRDGTRELALKFQEHPRVKLILEEQPRGKGHAVRTGFQAASGDYVLIQDADLEYDLEDYDGLLEPLMAGRAAFVLGSRHGGRNVMKMRQFAGEHGLSIFLNVGHSFFTTLINLLFFQRLRDPFTMFKVFRRDCLFGLEFDCNRFDFDFELLIKLIRKGYRPIELPVNYRSRSFKEGKKVRMFRDPLTWLRALIRLRFAEINPMKVAAQIQARRQTVTHE